MNSQLLIEMREGSALCSNLMDFEDAPQRLPKAPCEDGAVGLHPTEGPGMRFAFLIHPISEQTKNLMDLDRDGRLRKTWGRADLLGFCTEAHAAFEARSRPMPGGQPQGSRVIDTFAGLVSSTGTRAEGRLYEIPMDARSILADPDRALELMEQAVTDAIDWGARIVGLGSMTGIIGNHGAFLAERHPLAVTTGNSLTVYATLRNLEHYCESLGIDLADEEITVVGIPGSIATAVATLLAPRCRRLVLGARKASPRAIQCADRLGARLEVELSKALAEASLVVTATSSGDCIEPSWLRPGCLVLDVGVPSDIRRVAPERDDVLILSAGYARVPAAMPRDSFFLRFYHGIVPSCLGETMVLALENRADSFSIGRSLDLDRVHEIGRLAEAHGFAFSEALACGLPLSPEARSQFLKVLSRTRPAPSHRSHRCVCQTAGGVTADRVDGDAIDLAHLAEHAAERHARNINPVLIGVGGPTGLTRTFVRGEGAELFDESGRAYLDFVAGFGSLNLGHNHPAVVAAVASALSQRAPGFSPAAVNPLAAALAEELVAITPRGLEIVFFTNSGAESIEAALKLARAATGRSGLLSCLGSFHGKTFGALSVTGNRTYQRPFAPLVPDCQAIPYGDLQALELALVTRQHAAFVVEPIQGEGGMVTPPRGYLAEAHRLCRQAGTLFVADEVQTGLGRTGPLFAVEREGIEPDILTLAKSLGGGLMPLGAMIARRDHWLKAYGSYQTFALHSSTFSGGSLACAAGLATLRVLGDGPALVHAAHRASQLREGLEAVARTCPIIRSVRGHGLMLGLEFHELSPTLLTNFKGFSPSEGNWWLMPGHEDLLRSIPALYVQSNLLHEHAIYTQVARSNPRVLRVQPPLIVSAAQVERFLEVLRSTCAEWALIGECAEVILSKSAGEMGPR
jgi:acetylornithine/succinyldiaminopimelate/putrescine aminotransferase/predicted amino acid dehydrogenase